jgi:phytoene desaturase
MNRRKAIIIGSGIGGLALGIRLQSLGFDTTILEKLDAPGGCAHSVTPDNLQVVMFAIHT